MTGTTNSDYQKYEAWLKVKSREFARNGYDSIQPEDLWKYFDTFHWKKGRPARYHQQIKDIMTVQPNDYFNYASLDAQIYSNVSLDEMDLNDLLK